MSSNSREPSSENRQETPFGRRAVLKASGVALVGGMLGTGTAAARSSDATRSGTPVPIGNGTATAYTERERGQLSAVGIRFDASVLSGLPAQLAEYHIELPTGATGPFQFAGVDWNPNGHPPMELYGHPHFDVHFYMIDEDVVEDIPGGTATYTIPEMLMPADTTTTDREVVPAMGEHLVSPVSVPAVPGEDGWSVYIWGAYDPDGDGVGQLTFMEPMITVAYLQTLKGDGTGDAEAVTPLPMPERFLKGGWYPTESVVRYHAAADAFTVSLESFEQFTGYGRR